MAEPPQTKAIDPSGDVLLKLGHTGQPATNLLVNSRVLSFASPVFAAMFNGRFTEGQNLSSSAPREVPLPDDDPTGMEMLCNIAHLRASNLPNKIEHTALADFAILCDKYSSVDVVRSYCRMWMIDLLKDTEHEKYEKLLFAAYSLDLPHEFREITKVLVRDHVKVSVSVALHDGNLFPVSIIDTLQTHRLDAVKNMNAALVVPVFDEFLRGKYECRERNAMCGIAVRRFYSTGLFPVANMGLPSIREKVASMALLESSSCPSAQFCVCRGFIDMKTKMIEALDNFGKSVRGLCLDCIKGEITGEEVSKSTCRMAHCAGGLAPAKGSQECIL